MAGEILSLLLSLSVSGGSMVLLAFSVCKLFRKKVSKQWQYYIWLFVLVRFLLPFAPEENLMGNLGEHIQNMVQMVTTDSGREDVSSVSVRQGGVQDSPAEQETAETDSAAISEKRDGETGMMQKNHIFKTIWNGRGYLCIFLLMMSALLFLRKITIYQSFVRFVRASSTTVDDINRLEALSTTEAQLGIHKAVELRVNPLISSPMLIGLCCPCIVLPDNDLSEQAFYYTILHELMHYKRKDMYYKWVIQAVTCLHWFNPLVYVMGRSVNRLCELSCDEAVTARLEYGEQCREYAATLLNAMAYAGAYKEHLASLTLCENKENLKERMEVIMNRRKNTTANKALIAVLTMAITFTGIFAGSYTVGASGDVHNELKSQTGAMTNRESGDLGLDITGKSGEGHSKSDTITSGQADKMALELTDKIWVWDWVKFFVPYMSEKGVKKLIPASRNSQWAGSVDMTTGKRIKFTKKQINAARKKKSSKSLTCGDIDDHALMIMQSNGNWDCISFMLPYMTHRGIRAVVRCYNSKHGGSGKKAKDYYS